MGKRYLGLLAVFAFFLLCAAAAGAQAISGNTIAGKVRLPAGHPASNLLIQLETGNGIPISQTVTSAEGDYAFSGLEGATFVLVIDQPQYQQIRERVEFQREATSRPGETIHIDFALVAKGTPSAPPAGAVFHQDIPESAAAAYQRSVKLLADGRSDAGLAELARAAQIFPAYFDAHFKMGVELVRLNRYDEATRELEQARRINPRDGRVYYTFGVVLLAQKKFDVAAQVLSAALQLNPLDAQAELMRGTALLELGRLDEAEKSLTRADQIAANGLPVIHLRLAKIYEKRGDRHHAADELERYLKLMPDVSNAAAIRDAIKTLRGGEKKN
jgi:tetratricopeptide (TPR) repeat protein